MGFSRIFLYSIRLNRPSELRRGGAFERVWIHPHSIKHCLTTTSSGVYGCFVNLSLKCGRLHLTHFFATRDFSTQSIIRFGQAVKFGHRLERIRVRNFPFLLNFVHRPLNQCHCSHAKMFIAIWLLFSHQIPILILGSQKGITLKPSTKIGSFLRNLGLIFTTCIYLIVWDDFADIWDRVE